MLTLFTDVKLVLEDRITPGQLLVRDGTIEAILRADAAPPPDAALLHGGGRYLSPGFVELHVHGGGGFDFMDSDPGGMAAAAKAHMAHGTTSLLPTSVAAETVQLKKLIDTFKTVRDTMRGGPNLPGLHLEGPYLAMEQTGAIDPRHIRDPDPAEYRELVACAEGSILRWTIAPERPGALEMGVYLLRHGILPSMGHSSAEYSQVLAAFDNGYRLITHLYSACSTIVRRGGFRCSGIVESAYVVEGLYSEIIADGCHLPPELMKMVYRHIGPDRTCLTCDAIRMAAVDDAPHTACIGSRENGLEIIIEDGVAKLPDRSAFAGGIATDDRLVRNMVRLAGAPLHHAVKMMTLTPARVIGIDHKKGSIAPGKDADLLLFDENINIGLVMVGGTVRLNHLT